MDPTPTTIPGIVLVLPLVSALIIMLGHRVLKNVAHIIATGVAFIMLGCAFIFLGAQDNKDAIALFPFLKIGTFHANIGFIIDQQSRGMLFIVTFIGALVHLFSLGYMKEDAAKARYFGGLSLFMFSMNGIVLADNLIMMFIFWELVGFSSYLLIGHWFEKPEASDAAKKAFIVNRVGDFGFMTGILILFGVTGVTAGGVLNIAELKDSLNATGSPLMEFFNQHPGMFTLASVGLFLGAVGKSAQAPLHVWLPDAMEGPTPVSALIHAATMVAAGVYMLVRVHFLIGMSHMACDIIAWTGGITALLAALMATQQNDIKKILAYSTLSQLGYMVMAVGLAAPNEGMFHLYTHAFFKALLFLGSGAVIYACHHEQDIWKMGGLRHKMPGTFWTFVIGTAALMGVPLLSGFWSKEGILVAAYPTGHGGNIFLFIIGLVTAALTAFYMTRLVIVAFLGKPRTKHADHAHEVPFLMLVPLMILAFFSVFAGYDFIAKGLSALVPNEHHDGGTVVMICSILVLVAGFLGASRLYRGKDSDPVKIPLFANKFYFDEFYSWLVKYAQDRVAWIVNGLEKIFVGGLTIRVPAAISSGLGNLMRRLQTGSLQGYTFVLGLGIVVAVYLVVFFTTSKH
jgi:NADH-quinone oxidoreductase subunit L